MAQASMQGLEEICAAFRRWPRNVHSDYRTLAAECAEQALQLFGSDRVLLAYSEHDEPWMTIVEADHAGSTWHEEDEGPERLVDESLDGLSFLSSADGRVIRAPDGEVSTVAMPIHHEIAARCGKGLLLSVPIDSEDAQGRLFVCAPRLEQGVMLLSAGVVATLMSMRFEATSHTDLAVRDAVGEERIRVARDLHDGLLQSFTGVVLQLETIHATIDESPDEAKRMITDTQGTIMSDQRELRRFVEQLRPRPLRRETPYDFTARLEDLRARFEKQWGISIVYDVANIEPLVGAYLGQETFRLIHEAVMNSAKHGNASQVQVALKTAGGEMQIQVADNGSGFPFQGRLTLAQMRESGGGPMVLAERVHSLNGNLVVDSTDNGSTITISIPLGWGGAADGNDTRTR
jgi:signal transduction histidine kinase